MTVLIQEKSTSSFPKFINTPPSNIEDYRRISMIDSEANINYDEIDEKAAIFQSFGSVCNASKVSDYKTPSKKSFRSNRNNQNYLHNSTKTQSIFTTMSLGHPRKNMFCDGDLDRMFEEPIAEPDSVDSVDIVVSPKVMYS